MLACGESCSEGAALGGCRSVDWSEARATARDGEEGRGAAHPGAGLRLNFWNILKSSSRRRKNFEDTLEECLPRSKASGKAQFPVCQWGGEGSIYIRRLRRDTGLSNDSMTTIASILSNRFVSILEGVKAASSSDLASMHGRVAYSAAQLAVS